VNLAGEFGTLHDDVEAFRRGEPMGRGARYPYFYLFYYYYIFIYFVIFIRIFIYFIIIFLFILLLKYLATMLLTMVFFAGWLSRFKLIRRRRISLATLPRYGWMCG